MVSKGYVNKIAEIAATWSWIPELIHIDRDDRQHPLLIEAVELFKEEASGDMAELKIVEIPTGTRYRIISRVDDGFEYIETEADIKWEVA